MEIEQADRWLRLQSPLGADALVPTRVRGREALSATFSFEVDCVSPLRAIPPGDILGKRHTLEIGHRDELRRRVNGVVKRLDPGPVWARDHRHYRIELVPSLWLLSLTTDLRIFQDKTALDIIETVFAEAGLDDFDTSGVRAAPPERVYCVQYRESDLAFVERLMQEEGIFYWFEHREGGHTLKLADSAGAYTPNESPEIGFHPSGDVPGTIGSWEPRFEFRSASWHLRDYDFETPRETPEARRETVLDPPAFEQEVYDYPGGFTDKRRGEAVAELRMEAHEAGHELIDGAASVAMMLPGTTFTLRNHPSADQDGRSFAITEVRHEASDYSHVSGERGGGPLYENTFTCVPDSVPYRPAAAPRRPVVAGPHTATVVGPAGEEIYCDAYGRVKVQFHWDRLGREDERSSCWIRVAQPLAGNGWGALATPRIGMEVVVDFLEGDPDRPLIVGCVYNGMNAPPYDLPANRTQTGLKSRSSPGGGSDDFNELRFEDRAGEEQVYFHAQRDFDRVVERDDTLEVGNDQTATIGRDQTLTVERDQAITIRRGDRTISVELGSETTEAMNSIEMKVGQNSVVIDQSGVTIKGLNVTIKGDTSLKASALNTSVTGQGMLTLKGGMVKIN